MSNVEAPTVTKVEESDEFTVTDSKGRNLLYRPLNLMERGRLMRAVGNEASQNVLFFTHAAIVVGIREVDGVPTPWPSTVDQVDRRMNAIGDHGVEAVAAEIAKRVQPEDENELWAAAKN